MVHRINPRSEVDHKLLIGGYNLSCLDVNEPKNDNLEVCEWLKRNLDVNGFLTNGSFGHEKHDS